MPGAKHTPASSEFQLTFCPSFLEYRLVGQKLYYTHNRGGDDFKVGVVIHSNHQAVKVH